MVQGSKPLKANPNKKATSSNAQKKKASQPKKGARSIPPKNATALKNFQKRKAQTASVSRGLEEEMIAKAKGGGPLSLITGSSTASKEDNQGKGKAKAK